MIQSSSVFWQCVVGPKLYQTYPNLLPQDQQFTHLYIKNLAEIVSDSVLLCLKLCFGIFRVVWPLCLWYYYQNDALIYDNGISFLGHVICLTIIAMYFMLIRGYSRYINPSYENFAREFLQVKMNSTREIRQNFLSKYDFSLLHWKPDYIIDSSVVHQLPKVSITEVKLTLIERIFHRLILLLGYIGITIIGRRLIFPGSLQIIRYTRHRHLLDGRINLIVSYRGKRCLLRTADGNHIDTIFLDRRPSNTGQILVITCEGNAGFYEVGCMMTAIRSNYSVFGWNRPGFGESSGCPSVLSEINAIDSIMRYVTEELQFPIDQILLYAWSIGGYSACWTAVNYQNIRGLILDAIFDDILPLVQRQMPLFTTKLVQTTIRYYFNLNNIQLLQSYHGPFYLIRRTYDEIMNLIPNQPETNRVNTILLEILPYRYPCIYKTGDETLSLLQQYLLSNRKQRQILIDIYCSDNLQIEIDEYQSDNPIAFYPCKFGESFSLEKRKCFAIFLIDQYLIIFDSKHCTVLPQRYFSIPQRCV
ncbi:hypothetical protein I4U23_029128 [Adineta vaga]|nr:hypothetical protein I4U23_029128 [Adineta vaga]